MEKTNAHPLKERRQFGFIAGLFLVIMGTLPLLKSRPPSLIAYACAGVLFLLAAAFPTCLSPLYLLFQWIGEILGWVMTRLVLALLFFLILTPIGLIARCFGKRFLEMKPDPNRESYWEAMSEESDTDHYRRQY